MLVRNTSSASSSWASASSRALASSSETAARRSRENCRPMQAPIRATSRIGAARSRRAIRLSCSVEGMDRSGTGRRDGRRLAFGDQAALEYCLGQLLDEERNAIGLEDDLVEHFLGQRLATADILGHEHGLLARQAARAPAR